MKNVAVIGEIHSDGIDILKKNQFKVIDLSSIPNKDLAEHLDKVEGIVLRTAQISDEILESCKSLKIIARHGVGYDNLNLKFLNKKNIALAITGTSNAASVSEHVMTMFLYLCKMINKSDRLVREGKFKDKRSLPDFFELYKKNILILGFGRIGKALAKKCIGFDSHVYVNDPFIDPLIINENNCHEIDFEEGLKIADFISIHMPLNSNTKNLITKKEFSLMKKNCIIVNTSRGGIINESDLSWALTEKIIYGSGIDVYEKEPPNVDKELFKLDNIIFSPHNAALTIECRKRMAVESCENVVNFLNNSKDLNSKNIVNSKELRLDI